MINNKLKIQFSARNKRLKRNKITYEDYLKSDKWKEVKKFVGQFEEFQKCAVCSFNKNLNIHHKSYVKIFEPRLKIQKVYLVSLCQDCHYKIHKLCQEKNYGLRQGIKKYSKEYGKYK